MEHTSHSRVTSYISIIVLVSVQNLAMDTKHQTLPAAAIKLIWGQYVKLINPLETMLAIRKTLAMDASSIGPAAAIHNGLK